MKKYKGVTFMEVIIVIAIMGVMGSVGFVSLQSSKSETALSSAQQEVVAMIRLAQSYALQGRIQGTTTPCGYGFRFTSVSEYEIFYKTPVASNNCSVTDFASFNQVEKLQLGKDVVLSSPVDFTETEIYFAIPFGNIYGKGGMALGADKTISIQYPAGTGAIKSVFISSTGNIVEN